MAETPDYTQAGEVFRKSMEEALAHLDEVKENLLKEQEKAIDDQIAAKEEFKRIQSEAHQISEAYIDQHRKEYEQRVKNEILLDVVKKLILAEIPSNKLRTWLELSPQILADAWFYLGFEKMNEQHVGHVAYESSGRSGHVIFYRDDLTLRFPFEFAGANTLASIEIPPVERWESETRLSLDERLPILNFVANRVIRDQAQKCNFQITDHSIEIKY